MFVSAGTRHLSVLVVRAQDVVGDVSVEWRTVDGTARSAGNLIPDFVVSETSQNLMLTRLLR